MKWAHFPMKFFVLKPENVAEETPNNKNILTCLLSHFRDFILAVPRSFIVAPAAVECVEKMCELSRFHKNRFVCSCPEKKSLMNLVERTRNKMLYRDDGPVIN